MPDADAEQARAAAVVAALASAGTDAGTPIGLVVVPGAGIALATDSGRWTVRAPAGAVLAALEAEWAPRWTWWSAAGAPLVGAGVRPLRCWDAGAVHRLLRGGRREDAAAVWAAANDLPEPPEARPRRAAADGTGLLDLGGEEGSLVGPDGQLSADAADGSALRAADVGPDVALRRAAELAELVLVVRDAQELELEDLPDPRPAPRGPRLALQTAWSESAAALLAVELGADGLPLDRDRAEQLLAAVLGPAPADGREAAAQREARDAAVTALLTGRGAGGGPGGAGGRQVDAVDRIDLRSSAQVLRALQRIGLDLPDTRGWRLERHRGAHPAVDALLEWRRAERLDSTYGREWLRERVGPDARLRGTWSASDGGGGRMTAQAGLHNLPAELRPAVVAEPGHVFVRADLGQVEPRVLAAVSGDAALVAATHEDDLYLPVAEQLGSDRATAKIAVLAAMYGQTSGDAGRALQRMEAAYPTALAHLRAAEAAGREGRDLRTHGGRLLRLAEAAERAAPSSGPADPSSGPADPSSGAAGPDGGGEDAAGGGDLQGRGRFARNAVVQGAAAELFKAWAATVRIALLRAEAAARAADAEGATGDGSGTGSGAGPGAAAVAGRIVLCLHDELLLHVPEASAGAVQDLLHRSLDAAAGRWAAGSGVRFVAEVSAVRTWAEAK